MVTRPEHMILIVDDEEGILKSLTRLLKTLPINIKSALNAENALNILKNERASLIISDQRMPGLTGVEFLRKSREILPDSIRILLTGYADIEATIDAINEGAVKYYLTKPWDDEFLLSRVKESLDLYETTVEKNRLTKVTVKQNSKLQELNENLEQKVAEQTAKISKQHEDLSKSFMETIKAFSTIVETRLKEVGSHSQRVALLSRKMLEGFDLNEKEFQDIVVAAILHDIGKISIPDHLLCKSENNYSQSDIKEIQKHPILGQSCLVLINDFEEIATIIRHHHENFDGTGYPDRIRQKRIPLGSRIIRIVDSFDRHAFVRGYPTNERLKIAAAHLVQFTESKFDPDLVKKFIDLDLSKHLQLRGSLTDITVIQPSALDAGMIIAEDVYTNTGMFLVPKGAKLSAGMIRRITKIDSLDHIKTGIKIFKNVEKEEDRYAAIQNSFSR